VWAALKGRGIAAWREGPCWQSSKNTTHEEEFALNGALALKKPQGDNRRASEIILNPAKQPAGDCVSSFLCWKAVTTWKRRRGDVRPQVRLQLDSDSGRVQQKLADLAHLKGGKGGGTSF